MRIEKPRVGCPLKLYSILFHPRLVATVMLVDTILRSAKQCDGVDMFSVFKAFFARVRPQNKAPQEISDPFAILEEFGEEPHHESTGHNPFALPVSLDFEYTNGKGIKSFRYIEVKSLKRSKAGNPIIWGYCEQRQAIRCFRLDRMKNVYDANTGEVASEPLLDWLLAYSANQAVLRQALGMKI